MIIISTAMGILGLQFSHLRPNLLVDTISSNKTEELEKQAALKLLEDLRNQGITDDQTRVLIFQIPDGFNDLDQAAQKDVLHDIVKNTKPLSEGVAVVGTGDSFCAAVGRKIALSKALRACLVKDGLIYEIFEKDLRKEIWAEYQNKVRNPFPSCSWSYTHAMHRHQATQKAALEARRVKDARRQTLVHA